MTINEMVLQSQRGNGEVLAELCEKFQGMFFRAARQYHLRTVFEDALQAARESFLRAVPFRARRPRIRGDAAMGVVNAMHAQLVRAEESAEIELSA